MGRLLMKVVNEDVLLFLGSCNLNAVAPERTYTFAAREQLFKMYRINFVKTRHN